PPMAASASSRAKIHWSSLVTSSGKAKAAPSPWAALISAATALAPSWLMSATETLAPSLASLRANAAPSPWAPPVMKAFLPATRPAIVLALGFRRLIHERGQRHVPLGDAVRIVGRQGHVHAVPDVEPLRMMVELLRHQGHPGH